MGIERRYDSSRKRGFSHILSFEMIDRAGFNYWETSVIRNGNRVYIGHVENLRGEDLDIVVAERMRKDRSGQHTEWYLKYIPGFQIDDRTPEQQEGFERELDDVFSRKYRLAGRSVEDRIKFRVNTFLGK